MLLYFSLFPLWKLCSSLKNSSDSRRGVVSLTYLRLVRGRETATRCTPRRGSRLTIDRLLIGCERAYLLLPLGFRIAYREAWLFIGTRKRAGHNRGRYSSRGLSYQSRGLFGSVRPEEAVVRARDENALTLAWTTSNFSASHLKESRKLSRRAPRTLRPRASLVRQFTTAYLF